MTSQVVCSHLYNSQFEPHRVTVRADDGVTRLDITDRCFAVERFDDGTTDVSCYVKNDGQFVIDGNDVKTSIDTYPSSQVEVTKL